MAIKFTDDQQKVIDTRSKNILVSAAAGSGKTAVLVERIIQRIMDPINPIDIDRLLVVTFTNAAAAGMKEKIAKAIDKKLEVEGDNVHLQKQALLVHQAQITTIHSFCLYLIRNHFEAIELEPDFTIADEASIKLLATRVKDHLLEEHFTKAKAEFLEMVEFICHNGREKSLEDYITQLYQRAMSMPFPKKWLEDRKQDYTFQDLDTYTKTEAGEYLRNHVRALLESYLETYRVLYQVATKPDGPHMYADLLEQEAQFLETLLKEESLESLGSFLANMKFDRLSTKKDESVNLDKREWVKDKRSQLKKNIQSLALQFFSSSPQSIAEENKACQNAVVMLITLVQEFMEGLDLEKRKKGYIDFHDMEHMALQILLKQGEDGLEYSPIAKSYQDLFEEVMVDEYQDSNLVQEYLVSAVSRQEKGKENRFMVGDVKQSIYKFRLARPELFMDKYHDYEVESDAAVRIDLKKNFRSRKEVLDSVNAIFSKTMTKDLGGISYDDNAALHLGGTFLEATGMQTELLLADGDKPEQFKADEWEAYVVARRIQDLVKESYVQEEDGSGFRKAEYRDIVLLFRSPSNFEAVYKSMFEQMGIPLYMTSGSGYFDALEVQQVLHFLQVIENPHWDLSMYAVCTSVFGEMTESQLAKVKVNSVHEEELEPSFYEKLLDYQEVGEEEEIKSKIANLQEKISIYRRQMEYLSVSELLRNIFADSYYKEKVLALPDGEKRLANVELLQVKAVNFGKTNYHGLFAFLSYMEQMKKQEIDYGEANSLVEHANVVRVMSIHKSKGLEFPITFVCGMGQNYKMKDKQQMILIDNDLGLGLDYININRRSKNKTLRKHTIALKMEQEILAEEQRILYVAMTRAKEKLILCGYMEKAWETMERESELVLRADGTCLLSDLLAAKSYLQLCLLVRSPELPIEIKIITKEAVLEGEIVDTVRKEMGREKLYEVLEEEKENPYDAILAYRYAYQNLEALYYKTTVSEIKSRAILQEEEPSHILYEERESYVPDFMLKQEEKEEKLTAAQRGTAYHRVLEAINFSERAKYIGNEDACLQALVDQKRITRKQKECISHYALQQFFQSDLCQRMEQASKGGLLEKEKSFFLGVDAFELDAKLPKGEQILVQGMIDAYFEEDGELVLVDYKTDYITDIEELRLRYGIQMKYYTLALEKALGKKVKEIVLYSFGLHKVLVENLHKEVDNSSLT